MLDADFQVNMHWDSSVMRDGGILRVCQSRNIVIQEWSALQYGYFDGVFLNSDKYPQLNKVLKRMAEEKGVTLTAIALAWILRYPAKMQTVIGTTKTARIRESAKAPDFTLTKKRMVRTLFSGRK